MRSKVVTQECGCEVHFEPISRSLFIRERWGKFCPTHSEEFNQLHAAAAAANRERTAIRSLTEEI